MSRKVTATYTSEDVLQAFKLFSGDSPPGFMTKQQLETALTQYGHNRLTKQQTNTLLKNIDFDNNSLFNYEQYVALMKKH